MRNIAIILSVLVVLNISLWNMFSMGTKADITATTNGIYKIYRFKDDKCIFTEQDVAEQCIEKVAEYLSYQTPNMKKGEKVIVQVDDKCKLTLELTDDIYS